jgi:hypothetical protein
MSKELYKQLENFLKNKNFELLKNISHPDCKMIEFFIEEIEITPERYYTVDSLDEEYKFFVENFRQSNVYRFDTVVSLFKSEENIETLRKKVNITEKNHPKHFVTRKSKLLDPHLSREENLDMLNSLYISQHGSIFSHLFG